MNELEIPNKQIEIPEIQGLVTRHDDGSFSIDLERYLPEVKCSLLEIQIPFNKRFNEVKRRKNFDISQFKFEITQDDVDFVKIKMKDFGYGGNTTRNVARQHVVVRDGQYYIKVEIVDITYPLKRITCRCMSSSTENLEWMDGGNLPDQVLITTSFDQFYMIGKDLKEPTMDDLTSAIATMNRVGYGSLPGRWYYDDDLRRVRSFNSKTKTAIGVLRPIEAIQIANQLNAKGNWAGVQEFDMRNQVGSGQSKSIEKDLKV